MTRTVNIAMTKQEKDELRQLIADGDLVEAHKRIVGQHLHVVEEPTVIRFDDGGKPS